MSRQDGAILPAQDYALYTERKMCYLSYIVNLFLPKLVRSRWLDIDLVLFLAFMDLDSVLAHKHAKKDIGQ